MSPTLRRVPSTENVKVEEFNDFSKKSSQKPAIKNVDTSSNTSQSNGFISKLKTWFSKILNALSPF